MTSTLSCTLYRDDILRVLEWRAAALPFPEVHTGRIPPCSPYSRHAILIAVGVLRLKERALPLLPPPLLLAAGDWLHDCARACAGDTLEALKVKLKRDVVMNRADAVAAVRALPGRLSALRVLMVHRFRMAAWRFVWACFTG
jgi:hypothetical protein